MGNYWKKKYANKICYSCKNYILSARRSGTLYFIPNKLSRNVRERTFWQMRPAKIQIRLRICAVWSESSLGAYWIAQDPKFLHADNEDSDRTARMRRLVCVVVGRIYRKERVLTLRLK